HGATNAGDLAKVRTLLPASPGATVSTNAGRNTALRLAARLGQREIAGLLIAKSAELNITDKPGMSSLHVATGMEKMEFVEWFLANGADRRLADRVGHKP